MGTAGDLALDAHAGRAGWRRWLLAALVAATALLGGVLMWIVLGARGLSVMEVIFLALFVPAFAWIALSFWTALFGFVLVVLRRHPVTLRRHGPASGPMPAPAARTAILVPIYNEDADAVMSRLEQVWHSLADTGRLDAFSFFVLSDTTDAAIAVKEQHALAKVRDRLGARDRLFYRRRQQNTERKAGNIAEWVHNRSAGFTYMVILDADSVMEGDALVRLAALMDANPRTGIIQTHIVPAGRETSLPARCSTRRA